MTFSQLRQIVRADLYRYEGGKGVRHFVHLYFDQPGFRYSFWMRFCVFARGNSLRKLMLYPFVRHFWKYYGYKYGFDIPFDAAIGEGLYIGHFSGIIINRRAVIGKNCNLSPCVVVGQSNRGPRKGCPVIGDNVFIGPGAKIIGGIKIGNNAAIGANAVVTKDVPDNGVVVGAPGKVISMEGSQGYISYVDYAAAVSA